MDALYVCYWSLRDPLCQSQALSVLEGLAAEGRVFGLITFEQEPWRASTEEDEVLRLQLGRRGVRWLPLRYHKTPRGLSTLFDILQGALVAVREGSRSGVRVVHGRGSVGAAVAYLASQLLRRRFFNDADGPLSQEYADVGVWRNEGLLHRLTRWAEWRFLAAADVVAVLSERRRREVEGVCRRPPYVLPCAVDTRSFHADSAAREALRLRLGLKGTVLAYTGKAGGWYLTNEMLDFVATAREMFDQISMLVLSPDPADRFPAPPGITVAHVRAQREEVSAHLSAADAGLSFILPAPSKTACSPIKNGEYLACGLPIVTTADIGDYSSLVEETRTGVVVRRLDSASYKEAARELRALLLDPGVRERCRRTAERHFGLREVVLPRYREIYDALWADEDLS
jgi:glycosyltransferase involved in cell wall biosynthesis